MKKTNQELFNYIKNSPTAYHACAYTAEILEKAGFTRLFEGEKKPLEANKGYYITRNSSSLIAFKTPESEPCGFMITASHGDSPCPKIKENAALEDKYYTRLSTENYGGMIYSTWLDRPLAVAGRVTVNNGCGIEVKLVDSKKPAAIIPNVAIHMNRSVNSGMNYNPAVDLVPIYGAGDKNKSFKSFIAKLASVKEEDILTTDLYLYNPQEGIEWNNIISSPRLDDLQCAYSTLQGFLSAEKSESMPVYALFDNEEVGSRTKQGAASTFLRLTLERIAEAYGKRAEDLLPCSMMLSCDNAHAVHPNHPEYSDKNHSSHMNEGIVIKYNANQSYTSDAVSAALFKLVCKESDVPVQYYANRADMPGGSTLGNIANTQVSLNTVDIGLAQLAMHSSYESAGALDTDYMIKASKCFFAKSIKQTENGYCLA